MKRSPPTILEIRARVDALRKLAETHDHEKCVTEERRIHTEILTAIAGADTYKPPLSRAVCLALAAEAIETLAITFPRWSA